MTELDAYLRKFQKELSTGTVSLALLAVLAKAPEPLYGYLIAKELERTGEGVLSGKQSALYPVLRNLEGAGLLGQLRTQVFLGVVQRVLDHRQVSAAQCGTQLVQVFGNRRRQRPRVEFDSHQLTPSSTDSTESRVAFQAAIHCRRAARPSSLMR